MLMVWALATSLALGLGLSGSVTEEGHPERQDGEDDEVLGLKPGPGREAVLSYCLTCHSSVLIISAQMTRLQLDRTVTRMQEEEGMLELEPEVRRKILDYLEAAQSPDGESESE